MAITGPSATLTAQGWHVITSGIQATSVTYTVFENTDIDIHPPHTHMHKIHNGCNDF